MAKEICKNCHYLLKNEMCFLEGYFGHHMADIADRCNHRETDEEFARKRESHRIFKETLKRFEK